MTTATMTTDVELSAISPEHLTNLLIDGQWVKCRDAKLIQFAIAQAHSPASPNKVYPSLRYTTDQGRVVVSPLSKISGFQFE